MARIVLIRHGPSAHVDTPPSLDRAGVEAWRAAYDSAGILGDAKPPDALVKLAVDAKHLVASDLRRAQESAERLAPLRPIIVSELLRECTLAPPQWPTRLPLAAWGIAIYSRWAFDQMRDTDAAAQERARAAAAVDWITRMTADGATILVVTHAVFRQLLGDQLVKRGWASDGETGSQHWSAWNYWAERKPDKGEN